MRVPRRIGWILAAVAALAVALPSIALAATVQQLIDLAKSTYLMGCTPSATDVSCQNRAGNWTALIRPASGAE